MRKFLAKCKKRFLSQVPLKFKIFQSVTKAVEMSTEWYTLKKEKLLDSLKSTEAGLSDEEAERRLKEYGPNELIAKEGKCILEK